MNTNEAHSLVLCAHTLPTATHPHTSTTHLQHIHARPQTYKTQHRKNGFIRQARRPGGRLALNDEKKARHATALSISVLHLPYCMLPHCVLPRCMLRTVCTLMCSCMWLRGASHHHHRTSQPPHYCPFICFMRSLSRHMANSQVRQHC